MQDELPKYHLLQPSDTPMVIEVSSAPEHPGAGSNNQLPEDELDLLQIDADDVEMAAAPNVPGGNILSDEQEPPASLDEDMALLGAADAATAAIAKRLSAQPGEELQVSAEIEWPDNQHRNLKPRTTYVTGAKRELILFSVFSGLGHDILALVQHLGHQGTLAQFTGILIVEQDKELANAVCGHWRGVRSGTLPPCEILAYDVWDLMRAGAAALRGVAERLPQGCMALLAGGSPCQQMTTFGTGKGHLGLCGKDSKAFFALPTLAYTLAQLREDIHVEVVMECAGSTLEPHRCAVRACLGIDKAEMTNANTSAWTPLNRNRMVASTLVPPEPPAPPNPRNPPWREGWHFKGVTMGSFMRSRAGSAEHVLQVSSYQVLPEYLVFENHRWGHVTPTDTKEAIKGALPEGMKPKWEALIKTRANTTVDEEYCLPVVHWICEHGESHGLDHRTYTSVPLHLGPWIMQQHCSRATLEKSA